MEGLILTHIDDDGLRIYGSSFEQNLFRRIESDLERGVSVYNFKALERPSRKIATHKGIITIDYFQGKDEYDIDLSRNLEVQFLLGKKRMIDDGIDNAQICGWNIGVCINLIVGLMDGVYRGQYLEALGMTKEEYGTVIDTKIPIHMISELSRH